MKAKKLLAAILSASMVFSVASTGLTSVSAVSLTDTAIASETFESAELSSDYTAVAYNGANIAQEDQVSAPTIVEDTERGYVLSIETGEGAGGTNVANKSASYLQMPNPYSGATLTGATISYWVKSSEDYGTMLGFDYDWGFSIADQTPYVMYNTAAGYFDGHATSAIPSGEWAMVTVTVASSGITVYINGEAVGYSQSGLATIANVLSTLSNAYWATVGFVYSPFLGSRGGLYDDIYYFDYELSSSQVAELYEATSVGEGPEEPEEPEEPIGLVAYEEFGSEAMPEDYQAVAYNGENIENQVAAPTLVEDATRGYVLSIETGEGAGGTDVANKSASYLQMPNPYSGMTLAGATISYWVKSSEDYGVMAGFDSDWGFAIADATPYVMYNTAAGYFDGHATSAIPSDEWAMVTLTIDEDDGMALYVNGEPLEGSGEGTAGESEILSTLSNAYYATVGFVYSPFLGSRGGLYDAIYYYDYALTADEVVDLYNATYIAQPQEPVEEADKTNLQIDVNAFEAMDLSPYSEDLLVAFNGVMGTAQAVLDDPNATQDEVDAADEALVETVVLLLDVAYYDALDQSAYTDDSLVAFNAALLVAKATLGTAEAATEDISAAHDALIAAYNALVPAENEELSGWVEDEDGNWRFYDRDTHAIATGWMDDGNGVYWYFDEDGTIYQGDWLYDEEADSYYYFDDVSGQMVTGWRYIEDDEDYDGWHFFDRETGLETYGWLTDGKGVYWYFDPDGRMLQGEWLTDGLDNYWYFDGASGQMVTGDRYFEEYDATVTFSKTTGRAYMPLDFEPEPLYDTSLVLELR